MKKTYLLFLLLPIFLTVVISFYLNRSPERYFDPIIQVFHYQARLNQGAELKVKTLILGDSTAIRSFSAEYMGPDTVSLAGFGASGIELFHLLSRYLEKNAPPKCALISLSYNYEYKWRDEFWQYYVAHDFYSRDELRAIFEKGKELNDFPADRYSWPGYLFNYYLSQTKLRDFSLARFQKSLFVSQKANHKLFADALWERKGLLPKLSKGHDGPFFIPRFHEYVNHGFLPSRMNDYYLQETLRLLEEQKVKIFFVQTPVARSYWEKYKVQEFYAKRSEHFHKLTAKTANVHFVEQIDIYPDSHFYNANHLDRKSSELFTQEVLKRFHCD